MNKKGFTLIELLAVIVILAIIALIATPIVLDIINDSRESSYLRSAEFYLDALEQSMLRSEIKNKRINDGVYNILENGNICLEYDNSNNCIDILEIEIDGESPSSGSITIQNGSITSTTLNISNKEVIKNLKGNLMYTNTLNDICELKGEEKGLGSKYECKVDPNKDPYTFFVLSYNDKDGDIIDTKEGAVSVNLIMDSNIRKDGVPVNDSDLQDKGLVAWITKEDYTSKEIGGTEEEWDKECDDCGNSNKGPITAMNYLSEATKEWTNLTPMTISTFNDENGTIYTIEKTYNIYARMPYDSEIPSYDGTNGYLYNYLEKWDDKTTNPVSAVYGYRTLSSYTASPGLIWSVNYMGHLAYNYDDYVGNTNTFGVRPVITIKL